MIGFNSLLSASNAMQIELEENCARLELNYDGNR